MRTHRCGESLGTLGPKKYLPRLAATVDRQQLLPSFSAQWARSCIMQERQITEAWRAAHRPLFHSRP